MHINKLFAAGTWAIAAMLVIPGTAFTDQTYKTDQGHTEVLFGWSHAGVSMQHAEFTVATGTLNLADEIEQSSISVVIDANSLSSGLAALDDDLKSKNFLDVMTYPEITFQSTAVKQTGERSFDVTGDLTIHGVTKPTILKAEMTHRGEHPVAKFFDYYKGEWVAFRATAEIDNMDFNVGSFPTGPIVIEINTELQAK